MSTEAQCSNCEAAKAAKDRAHIALRDREREALDAHAVNDELRATLRQLAQEIIVADRSMDRSRDGLVLSKLASRARVALDIVNEAQWHVDNERRPCGVMVSNDPRARCSKESDHDGDCDIVPDRHGSKEPSNV